MSLIGFALRFCAVNALVGANTLAGARVFDSAFLPIDQISTSDARPVVSISTEDENDRPNGRDINSGSRTIDLGIEIAVARAVPLPAQDDEGDLIQIEVAESDANIELAVAVLNRQITSCLWGRGGGVWGHLFRLLSSGVEEAKSRRGIPVKDGQRLAARQTIYTLRTLAEPAFAMPPEQGTPIAEFLLALEAEPAFADHARIIRAAVESKPLDWPEFFTASAVAGGYTEAEARSLGIAPLGGDPAADLSAVSIPSAGWRLDEEAMRENLPSAADEP